MKSIIILVIGKRSKDINMGKSQSGFTLVELVIVIVILGILAATALPRFLDVSDQAHEAAVAGAGGALGTGAMLTHAGWIANGQSSPVSLDGTNVVVNSSGWPSAASNTAATCVSNVWNAVMVNPPVATSATATNTVYLATFAANVCTFDYRGKSSLATGTMSISFNVLTGAILVDSTI